MGYELDWLRRVRTLYKLFLQFLPLFCVSIVLRASTLLNSTQCVKIPITDLLTTTQQLSRIHLPHRDHFTTRHNG